MGTAKLISVVLLAVALFLVTVVILLANRTRPIGQRLVNTHQSPDRRVSVR